MCINNIGFNNGIGRVKGYIGYIFIIVFKVIFLINR